MKTTFCFLRNLAVVCLVLSASAATPAVDRGPLVVLDGTTPISVTIALALPALNDAVKLQEALYTPGDPQFHQFLTADQFVARFAPTGAGIAKVIAALARFRLAAEKTTATTLKVTGMPADMERAFSVSLHRYEVAPGDNIPGYTFHAPLSRPTIPSEVSSAVPVAALVGLDNRPSAHPHYRYAPPVLRSVLQSAPSTKTGNPFGALTVTDFANDYDVQPLYGRGVTGSGRTLGILTLAAFTPTDAYKYWQAVGLKVASNRIQIVNIDGGPGAPSDASGSLETTLDVEQSGGIAPGANIIVYQAPNTNQGFVDLFATAIDANLAETLSTSWGDWEWLENLENSPVTDPATGRTVGTTQAIHELLLRASIQGQTPFAAAGDGGAYDVVNDLGCVPPYSPSVATSCTATLSVDYPASDTLITAAGGTTLPGLQEYCLNAACSPPYYDINIQHESVWGWDYLEGLCKVQGFNNPIACGIFPAGGGGGVSIAFAEPQYQFGLFGTQISQPFQFFLAGSSFGTGLEYFLPAFYPGRNLPDVSFNADPDTGYVVYYTSNVTGFGAVNFVGGTSFVAPQLNGVTALLGQSLNQRIGSLNTALYGLAVTGKAYGGSGAPLHAIAYGDNWFYYGSNGYNLGAGLGTLDVANFAEVLRSQSGPTGYQ
jgi:subtilase family serine protease